MANFTSKDKDTSLIQDWIARFPEFAARIEEAQTLQAVRKIKAEMIKLSDLGQTNIPDGVILGLIEIRIDEIKEAQTDHIQRPAGERRIARMANVYTSDGRTARKWN